VLERLATRLGVPASGLLGSFTFDDIVKDLEKPGRDPRAGFVSFAYRQGIYALKDLEPGMVCPGIVTNVTNFGAFVAIGVHQDGLVHISQIADRFVKDPREVVSPGDRVTVRVGDKKALSDRAGDGGHRWWGGGRREHHAEHIGDPPAGPVINCNFAPASAGQSVKPRPAGAVKARAEGWRRVGGTDECQGARRERR
jgi:hypothetical protein